MKTKKEKKMSKLIRSKRPIQ